MEKLRQLKKEYDEINQLKENTDTKLQKNHNISKRNRIDKNKIQLKNVFTGQH